MSPTRARIVMEGLYKDLERRIESSPPGLCPVDMARAFLELCHAQTCGKCVPCRIGLGQLNQLIRDVLNGKATMDTLDLMEKTALSIMDSADCAIGYEAANMVYKGLIGYRDDYVEHIRNGRCTCTYNQPVPCVAICPAHVDIPGYVALVEEGRYADAIRLIRKDNPFPTTCGFICEHPCEARCRRNMVDDAVNIRGLKRFAADYAGFVDPPECAPSTGKKVAVLGGGPGGLSAAYYLQLMGHQTTVYEMLPKLGGMLRYGIPNYRLPKDRLDEDINAILKTGVEVKQGLKIGVDITIQELREQYDAVLITIGASTDKKLGLPGEDADGVLSAVQFLRSVGKDEIIDLTGKEVVVIGGGNVSMDAVRTAKRLGAKKVSILYRRRRNDMTALPGEIEGAIAEGIEIVTLKAPASLNVGEDHKIHGIYATPQMISAIRDGRASVKPTGEPDVYIPCDVLIKAIGQDIESGHFEKAGIPVSRGKIVTLKAPASLDVGEDHKIHGIYATPQMISAIKDGRASVKPTGEPDVYIPCDILIKAIGQDIESGHFEKAGIPVSRGKIVTLKSGAFENMPGVFAGGDCSSGPASVIKAIAAAKVVAANIDEYLGYHHEITSGVEIPEASLKDKTPCGRVNLTERDACERVCDFNAVENCMTEKEAKQEAGRCLRCDHFGYGIFKGGRSTLW